MPLLLRMRRALLYPFIKMPRAGSLAALKNLLVSEACRRSLLAAGKAAVCAIPCMQHVHHTLTFILLFISGFQACVGLCWCKRGSG